MNGNCLLNNTLAVSSVFRIKQFELRSTATLLGFDVVGVDFHRLHVVLLSGLAADRLVSVARLGVLELVVGLDLFVSELKKIEWKV